MSNYSQWFNAERASELVKLFIDCGDKCLQGHPYCGIPEHHFVQTTKILTGTKLVRMPYENEDTGKYEWQYVPKKYKVAVPEYDMKILYDVLLENKIADYKDEDKARWHFERKQMHSLGEPYLYSRGRWNAVARDIFYSRQLAYKVLGIGVNPINYQPFVKIRLSSSYEYLYIDIPIQKIFKTVSKSAKRKAIRYNKMKSGISEQIDKLINDTVVQYVYNAKHKII